MNREILFRGFHPCEDGSATIYVDGKAVKGRWVEGDIIHNYFKVDDVCICVDRKWHEIKRVIHSTIGQYTTCDDKNGKRIFEGDNIREHRLCDEQTQDKIYMIGSERKMFVAKNISNENVVSLCTITVQSELEIISTIWDKERRDERD